jgi:hypothetical protein
MTPDDGSPPGESGPVARSPRDLIRRDCEHSGTPHVHGTRVAYVSDRCGCTLCRAANRGTDQRRTAAIALGRWEPFVDSRPVSDHLVMLRKEGLGIDRIAQLTAVPRSTIQRISSPDTKRPKRIRSDIAKRLIALRSTAEQVSPHSHVDSQSTRLRVETLVGAGHSLADVARAIGKTAASLRRSLERRAVTAHTAAAVEALYARHVDRDLHACSATPHATRPAAPHSGVDRRHRLDWLARLSARRLCFKGNTTDHPNPSTRRGGNLGPQFALLGRRSHDWPRDPPTCRAISIIDGPACRSISTIATRFNRRMGHRPGPGRKSKGDRDNFAVKPMRPVGDVIRANADRLGMTYGEYCAAILSTALGMPEYAPLPTPVEQQELPLKTA